MNLRFATTPPFPIVLVVQSVTSFPRRGGRVGALLQRASTFINSSKVGFLRTKVTGDGGEEVESLLSLLVLEMDEEDVDETEELDVDETEELDVDETEELDVDKADEEESDSIMLFGRMNVVLLHQMRSTQSTVARNALHTTSRACQEALHTKYSYLQHNFKKILQKIQVLVGKKNKRNLLSYIISYYSINTTG